MEKSRNYIRIDLSNDYYTAYLTIERDPDAPAVRESDVMAALKERAVVFGINPNAIAEAISKGEVMNFPVAEGQRHENGRDAEIVYHFDTGEKSKPEMLEDGTVNFKNLGIVKPVAAGSVIVEKKPATKAKAGTTVTGRNIMGRDGKDKVLGAGKNTHLSEDGLSILSDIDGNIHYDGRLVSVDSVMEIKGDVGISTGNLSFVGSIVVNGNICDGYEVTTTGDLTVNGVVEGAVIHVGGDFIVSRGIKGHDDAHIEVDGNMTTGFINSADVTVKGNLEANAIMTSKVRCDGSIKLSGKKGQLVGGEIVCKGNVEAKIIGSDLEVITDIKLGLDSELVEDIRNLAVGIKEKAELHDKLGKEIQTALTKLKLTPDNDRLKLILAKSKKEYDESEAAQREMKARLAMLQELANSHMTAQLRVGLLYPGTRVKIGNSNYLVKFPMQNTILKRDKGEIVTLGY